MKIPVIALLSSLLLAANPALADDAARARTNYLLYCSGCHLPSGIGNPPNVPTLHGELGRMMAVEEMRSYLVRVPGSSQARLTDDELADVVNWLLYEFNDGTLPEDFQPISAEEVTASRVNILADPLKYRIQYWKNYDF